MRVVRYRSAGSEGFELVDDDGNTDPLAASFAAALIGRGCTRRRIEQLLTDLDEPIATLA